MVLSASPTFCSRSCFCYYPGQRAGIVTSLCREKWLAKQRSTVTPRHQVTPVGSTSLLVTAVGCGTRVPDCAVRSRQDWSGVGNRTCVVAVAALPLVFCGALWHGKCPSHCGVLLCARPCAVTTGVLSVGLGDVTKSRCHDPSLPRKQRAQGPGAGEKQQPPRCPSLASELPGPVTQQGGHGRPLCTQGNWGARG